MIKQLIFLSFGMLSTSYGFYVEYKLDNNDFIKSEGETEVNSINQLIDKNLKEYAAKRTGILNYATTGGIMISPLWGIRGAHTSTIGRGEWGLYSNRDLLGTYSSLITYTYHMKGADVALSLTEGGAYTEKILMAPNPSIIERATIDEVRDSNNKFYAIGSSLHNSKNENWENNSSNPNHFFIVPCKPTINDPLTSPTLRFDIDDVASYPLKFRTYGGDSTFPFVLCKPSGEIKLVGVHNPNTTWFEVHHVSRPSTRAQIDYYILSQAVTQLEELKTYLEQYSEFTLAEYTWFNEKNMGFLVGPNQFLFVTDPSEFFDSNVNSIMVSGKKYSILKKEKIGGFMLMHTDYKNQGRIPYFSTESGLYMKPTRNADTFAEISVENGNIIDPTNSKKVLVRLDDRSRLSFAYSEERDSGMPIFDKKAQYRQPETYLSLTGLYDQHAGNAKAVILTDLDKKQIHYSILSYIMGN